MQTTRKANKHKMAKVRAINDILQKVAIEELNEIPERIPADIEAIRTWIQQQPHLNARTDDQFLLSFLRGCKYSLEKAKSKIDQYYTFRTKFPELLSCYNANDARFRELLRLGVYLVLPTPLHDYGPRIILLRGGIYSPDKYNFTEVVRLMVTILDIIMFEDDYANIYGMVLIMDAANGTFAHFLQMTPRVMKAYGVFSEKAIPLRPKGNHMFNTFAAIEPVFNMVKPILSEKQRERFFIHGTTLESLHKYVPQKYLPVEYGGENGTIADIIARWELKINDYADYLSDSAKYGTDEKLRTGSAMSYDNLFGTEGSFRKLEFD